MARPDSEKCRLCAKLSVQDAQQRHGNTGDGCWSPKYCHNRRSYYRHRGIRNHLRKRRRQDELGQTAQAQTDAQRVEGESSLAQVAPGQVIELKIPAPAVPAAVVHWYRETKDSPLHALGAELWMGNDRVAKVEPVHCLGLTELQVKTLLVRMLSEFSQHCGLKIERFRSAVELHPLNCPLHPCPLHPEGNR
jgi:hypothetical protein